MLFSALVMRCVRKIDLEYENGKQLQVTIIKITEITDSKEDNSIHRLDVSGSTGLGGAGSCPAQSPPAASQGNVIPESNNETEKKNR